MYALKKSVWCNGSKCIKQIVVFGPFYCFYLLWNKTKPFSGQKLAIFSHFIAHDGSKIAPIPEILSQKFLVPYLYHWDIIKSKLQLKTISLCVEIKCPKNSGFSGFKISPIPDILVPKNSQCLCWLLRCPRVENCMQKWR